ncbi:two component transcriptional regulator, LuxR family [Dethiosulfatibacter aminovorans DSM 17477]|uniref:Two component transcriptional regulator, LuxR family n=1 Tax=Dethiosulfatibacter aminovorans DSM 17477 TaxID=1121476 RepID=A0A1M6I1I9_9FIRM|nr:response regulator transcription factor [Dethiosulfatibacter aminovorans]SHJ28321.1 two component transcriptional regulator, LuxR family [Dethiosulfatibacter aminovorans DSM 17477]
MIKIMLADDQTLLRDGLKTIINFQEDMEVTEQASNGREAVDTALAAKPDVILMDIRMPEMDGVEAVRIIKDENPDIKIIMLTTFDDDDYVVDAIYYGAEGYLLKDIDTEKLLGFIRDVSRGETVLPSNIAAKLAKKIKMERSTSENVTLNAGELTNREKEIGLLLAEGLTNSEISQKLYLSNGTVKNYISSIYSKFNTSNRTKVGLMIKEMADQ